MQGSAATSVESWTGIGTLAQELQYRVQRLLWALEDKSVLDEVESDPEVLVRVRLYKVMSTLNLLEEMSWQCGAEA